MCFSLCVFSDLADCPHPQHVQREERRAKEHPQASADVTNLWILKIFIEKTKFNNPFV